MRTFNAQSVLTLLLVAPTVSFAQEHVNPATEIFVQRLQDIRESSIARSYDAATAVPLSRARTGRTIASLLPAERSPKPFAEAVAILDVDRSLLLPVANATSPLLLNRVPRESAHTRLEIGGREFVLTVVDQIYDRKYELRHVMAAIVNAAGYVRFTIDDTEGLMVASLHTNESDFRVLPSRSGGQIVYRMDREGSGGDLSPRYLPIARSAEHGDRATKIENRHLQIELIAELQPTYVRTSPGDSSIALDGEDLGRIDVTEISGETVNTLLRSLSPLTHVTGNEEFEVTRVLGGGEGYKGDYAVAFRQLIDGIPVAMPREIQLRNDGRVISVSSRVVDQTYQRVMPQIDRERATKLSLEAIARHLGSQASSVSAIARSAELSYRVDSVSRSLEPRWIVEVGAGEFGEFLVNVDAVTGNTLVLRNAIPAIGEDFRQYICLRTSGSPTECCQADSGTYGCNEVSGTAIAWREYNEASIECEPTNPVVNCYDPSLLTPKDITAIVEAQWELAVGNQSSLCCYGVGGADNRIDVIVGTPAAEEFGAQYDRYTRNILIPPYPTGQPELSLSRSPDVMTHELVHGLHHLNESLNAEYSAPDQVARSFMEGLADAMTGTMAEKVTWGGYQWGEPWVFGDAPPPYDVSDQRDLRIPQTFSTIFNTNLNMHERGMAVGNFFYRIKGGFSSLARFIEFQLSVNRLLEDNHVSGIDLDDFRDAIDRSLKTGETAALNTINDVWTEMDDTIIVTPSPPAAPWFVDGTPLGCVGGYSQYLLGWSQVSGATFYEIWYFHNGVLHFEATTPASPGYVYTTITADMRVKACNNHGCSPLSVDGFVVQPTLCP